MGENSNPVDFFGQTWKVDENGLIIEYDIDGNLIGAVGEVYGVTSFDEGNKQLALARARLIEKTPTMYNIISTAPHLLFPIADVMGKILNYVDGKENNND